MRSLLTALLAFLFMVLITADRFACPDGCTDEAPAQTTSQHTTSSCAICHGWNEAPAIVAPRPAPRFIARQPIVVTDPTEPAHPAVERPPKAA